MPYLGLLDVVSFLSYLFCLVNYVTLFNLYAALFSYVLDLFIASVIFVYIITC